MKIAVKVDSVSTQAFLPTVARCLQQENALRGELRLIHTDGRVSTVVCDEVFPNYNKAKLFKNALVTKLKYHGACIEEVRVSPNDDGLFISIDDYICELEVKAHIQEKGIVMPHPVFTGDMPVTGLA